MIGETVRQVKVGDRIVDAMGFIDAPGTVLMFCGDVHSFTVRWDDGFISEEWVEEYGQEWVFEGE